MPYGQSSVNYITPSILAEGQVYSNVGVNEVLERLNKTSVIIPFGRALVAGASKDLVKLPDASGQTPVGISIFSSFISQPPLGSTEASGYPVNSLVSFVRGNNGNKIEIVVYSATATDIDDPVHFRHANGSGLAGFGTFRVGTNADYTLFPGCRFARKTSGAGLTVISMSGS